ncbi:MAG: FadR family transcriptional regulator [Firmicutes bacterium]|nr:FadR family transcriptional regulator [Bacillota bacterium]
MQGRSTLTPNLGAPLKSGSLVRLIIGRIEEALVNKELKPGDKLPPEAQLAKIMGVGKNSVREALRMLEALGVVEVRHGDGSYIVEEPTSESINPLVFALLIEKGSNEQIYELRLQLEPAFTGLAAQKATEEDFARLEAMIDELAHEVEEGKSMPETDLSFHYAILEICRNPYLYRIGRAALQLFKASIGSSMKPDPRNAVRDHRKILTAMRTRDPEKVRAAVVETLEGWKVRGLALKD